MISVSNVRTISGVIVLSVAGWALHKKFSPKTKNRDETTPTASETGNLRDTSLDPTGKFIKSNYWKENVITLRTAVVLIKLFHCSVPQITFHKIDGFL